MAGRRTPPLLDTRFEILFPKVLPTAIDIAAANRLVSSGEYIRQSIIDRLRSDGIDLLALMKNDTKTEIAA